MSCRLIVNADDFGQSHGVNEAICALYDEGVVTSASLMVAGDASEDAVARARERPGLAVGLHVALVHAPAFLPPDAVPRLVGSDGRLTVNHVRSGLLATLDAAYRRELRRELDAQIRAFDQLDLGWSHVDTHVHFGLTPAVFRMLLDAIKQYPVVGLRVPEDDYALYRQLNPADAPRHRALALWFTLACRLQRRALRGTGYVVARRCYGLFRTHCITADYVSALVRALPDGDAELHCHPDLSTPEGRQEFEALRGKSFRRALTERSVTLATYGALRDAGSSISPLL